VAEFERPERKAVFPERDFTSAEIDLPSPQPTMVLSCDRFRTVKQNHGLMARAFSISGDRKVISRDRKPMSRDPRKISGDPFAIWRDLFAISEQSMVDTYRPKPPSQSIHGL